MVGKLGPSRSINARCHWFDDQGEPRHMDGRMGCPRPASCSFVHPDDPRWPELPPSRIPSYMTVDREAGRGRRDSRGHTPPRPLARLSAHRGRLSPTPRSPMASSSLSRAHTPPRTPMLSFTPRPKSPRDHARTPPRPRSPPTQPRAVPRPQSQTPLRAHTPSCVPSPRRSISRESRPEQKAGHDRAANGTNGGIPLRPPESSAQIPQHESSTVPSELHNNRSLDLGAPPRRERSTDSAHTRAAHPGISPFEGVRGRSPTMPLALADPIAGRFHPIAFGFRAQVNGSKAAPVTTINMPPPPAPPIPTSHSKTRSEVVLQSMNPPKELTYTEKRDIWVERIKILTDATIARSEHLRLTQEVEKYQRLTRSARYSAISEEDQARLDAQLSNMSAQLDIKKNELNAILPRLVNVDFWGPTANAPPDIDAFRTEIEGVVDELKTKIQQLHDQYGQLRVVPSDSKQATVAEAPHVPHEGPPAKRRRLSSEETTLVISEEEQKPSGIASAFTADMYDRLLQMEERLSELENGLVELDNNLLDQAEDLVRSRIEELQHNLKSSMPTPDDLQQRPQSTQADLHHPGFRHMQTELATTGNQVEELANEVASLITQMDARDKEHTRLAQENEQLKQRIAVLEGQRTADVAAIEANKAEIQALSTAVQSCISQAPGPAQCPSLQQVPSFDEIIQKIHPTLIQSLHEDMEPLLLDTHRTIDTMLQDQLKNVFSTLLMKMSPTMKTVDVVAAWMDRVRRGEPYVDSHVQSTDMS